MQKPIPLINVSGQNQKLKAEIMEALSRVYDSSAYIMGPEVMSLEAEFKSYTGVNHAVSCASGTDALIIPLMAMDLKPGDEVLVPSFTFYATVASVVRAGARPVFVDSDDSYNISLDDLTKKISTKTRAVIPVHLFGQMVDMPALKMILKAQTQKIYILEDAAQSMGSSIGGKQAGCWGDFGAYSFYPTKNLGAMGDAGMMSAREPEMAEKISMIRVHGSKQRYYHDYIGFNSRLDSMQAAVLRIKLKHLKEYEANRTNIANEYLKHFTNCNLVTGEKIKLPQFRDASGLVWNQFTIRAKKRDELRKFLAENSIGSEIYYPLPMHMQKSFAYCAPKVGSLPMCEAMASDVLSLPIYPEMDLADVERVVATIIKFYT